MVPPGLLRPRTVGEILDASFQLYRRHFARALLAATIVSLPTLILSALYAGEAGKVMHDYMDWAMSYGQKQAAGHFDFQEYWGELMGQVGRLQVIALLGAVLQSASRGGATAVMALITWYAATGAPMPGAWTLVRRSLPRIPSIVFMNFVTWQVAGMFACCLPITIFVLALTMPAPAVMMLERGKLEARARAAAARRGAVPRLLLLCTLVQAAICFDGLVRSLTLSFHGRTLARGSLVVFYLWCFLSFFVSAITVACLYAGGMAEATGFADVSLAPAFWAQHYAEVAVLPVLGASVTLWYLDLRTRREGIDMVPLAETVAEAQA